MRSPVTLHQERSKEFMSPPRLFHRFFRWYCHPRLLDSIEGDLIEIYRERLQSHGKRRADIRFIIDVLLLFRPKIIRPLEGSTNVNQYGMFKNYFTVGWRTLARNKGYSAINIFGLAAGMAVAVLIGLWINDELSYNKHFTNYDRIGKVMVHNGVGTYPSNPMPMETELRTNYSADIKRITICEWTRQYSVTIGDKKFLELGTFMRPESAEMFSLDMIHGTRTTLTEPNTIMISQSLSEKLFGDGDPVNQVVRIKNLVDLRIGGVYRDFPANSAFQQLNFIGSFEFLLSWMAWKKDFEANWDENSYLIYVELNEGVDFDDFSAKIRDIKMKHVNQRGREGRPEVFVHPMRKWHLYSNFKDRKISTSDQLQFAWLYGIIGVFVLMLACINFMNLSTARSEKRAKEVGVRKVMGSYRNQLVMQFFSESFITVIIACSISIVLVVLVLPFFNDVAAKQISVPWTKNLFWVALLGFALVTGLLAGSYPALYLSAFKPVKVLKGTLNIGRLASLPRQALVVVQFTVSVVLIVGTVIVYQQIQFAKHRPVGYTREGLITVFKITPDLFQRYEVIRNELLQSGAVEQVAHSSAPVTDVWSSSSGFDWDGKPASMETSFAVNWVKGPYGKTVGWQFVEGRDFSDEFVSDSAAVVVNETLVKTMGVEDPIGKELRWQGHKLQIVGVIKDMLMGSPYEPVLPTLFRYVDENIYAINIRLNPSMPVSESLGRVESVFQKHNPSVPFQFKFVDEEYANKFSSEERVGKLASVFAGLAILISLLGLFGLSSFVAEQRTKEVAIRKVVGASLWNIWSMLTKNFVTLVALSATIAFPLSWYFLSGWLTKFPYRVDIAWWIFPVVMIGALAITLITVSYQAIRAALSNPVDSLRAE